MKKYLIAALILFSLTLYANAQVATEETITLTTYYPAPYGVYNEMKLYPHSPSVTPCSPTQEGLMYYDSIAHALRVCMCADPPTCSTYSWVDTTGYWTLSGSNLYPNDTSWNVGIGTTNPLYRLDVNGMIASRGDRTHLLGKDSFGYHWINTQNPDGSSATTLGFKNTAGDKKVVVESGWNLQVKGNLYAGAGFYNAIVTRGDSCSDWGLIARCVLPGGGDRICGCSQTPGGNYRWRILNLD